MLPRAYGDTATHTATQRLSQPRAPYTEPNVHPPPPFDAMFLWMCEEGGCD